ncbi:MAG: hypothetical protein HYU97_06195 [Deltaproteobacteria bacterium]|nr:hypothetical protein [Deltaproteobacteria bacterium]
MHRTTIPLETKVEKELRLLSLQEKRSFKELVNELLREGLQSYRIRNKKKVEFHWNSSKAEPVAHFDPSDRSTYFDLISKNNL